MAVVGVAEVVALAELLLGLLLLADDEVRDLVFDLAQLHQDVLVRDRALVALDVLVRAVHLDAHLLQHIAQRGDHVRLDQLQLLLLLLALLLAA